MPSFPDLGLERQLEAKLPVGVEGASPTLAVDLERGIAGPRSAKPVQPLGHEPTGQAASTVLGHGSDRADEANRLRARIEGVPLDLAQGDGSRFAVRRRDGQQAELRRFPRHQLALAALRKLQWSANERLCTSAQEKAREMPNPSTSS